MPLIAAYYRPDSIEEALTLLADPNRIPLAGGTTVNADRAHSDVEVVDLQALGLGAITPDGTLIRIGATASLASVMNSDHLPETLRSIARREEPSTLRTLATVGGSVASADADSLFVAALLAHNARVELAGADNAPLPDVLASGIPAGAVITAVVIDPSGATAFSATGRTPADTPIVAAVARNANGSATLALTGVAATPVVVDAADPTGGLEPPDDFRGSSAYRLELASVLSVRALEGVR